MGTKLSCLMIKLVGIFWNLFFSPADIMIHGLTAKHSVPRSCQVFTRLLADHVYYTSICSHILRTVCPLIVSRSFCYTKITIMLDAALTKSQKTRFFPKAIPFWFKALAGCKGELRGARTIIQKGW